MVRLNAASHGGTVPVGVGIYNRATRRASRRSCFSILLLAILGHGRVCAATLLRRSTTGTHATDSHATGSRSVQERMGADDDNPGSTSTNSSSGGSNRTSFVFPVDDDTDLPPARLILEPFRVTLGPTESALVDSELRFLLDTMETVVYDYIQNQTAIMARARFLEGEAISANLEYVKFGTTAQQVYAADTETVALLFDKGVASFTAQPTPDPALVNMWVQDSLLLSLVENIQTTTVLTFQSVSTLAFEWQNPTVVVLAPAPTTPIAPATVPTPTLNAVVADTSRSVQGGGRRDVNVPLIAGTTVAAAALVLLLVVAATRRTTNNNNKAHAVELRSTGHMNDSNTKQPQSSLLPGSLQGSGTASDGRKRTNLPKSLPTGIAPGAIMDERSVADSESEWTVATEAGDTTALKSIYPTHSLLQTNTANGTASTAATSPVDPIGLALSESFERNRQVAITKDMLTGQWSGRIHNRGGSSGQQSESVLQPSHFSASQERRVRKAAKAAAAAAKSTTTGCPDRETSSISSREDTSSNDGSVGLGSSTGQFWKSQGVQVSPSQTSKRRNTARSPPSMAGTAEL